MPPQKKSPGELGRCAGETLRAVGEFVRWPGWVRASNFGEPPQEVRSSLFSEPKGQHGFFGCFRRFPSSECARKKRLKKDSSVGNSKCCWTPSNDYSSWSNYTGRIFSSIILLNIINLWSKISSTLQITYLRDPDQLKNNRTEINWTMH